MQNFSLNLIFIPTEHLAIIKYLIYNITHLDGLGVVRNQYITIKIKPNISLYKSEKQR